MSMISIAGQSTASHSRFRVPNAMRLFMIASILCVAIPVMALVLSLVNGGLATASVLFFIGIGVLWTNPLLLVAVTICAAVLSIAALVTMADASKKAAHSIDSVRA